MEFLLSIESSHLECVVYELTMCTKEDCEALEGVSLRTAFARKSLLLFGEDLIKRGNRSARASGIYSRSIARAN
jgi:hypothetical protein